MLRSDVDERTNATEQITEGEAIGTYTSGVRCRIGTDQEVGLQINDRREESESR